MNGRSLRGRLSLPGAFRPLTAPVLVLVIALGATCAALVLAGPSADQVRARLSADASAGRLDSAEVALAWLSRHDRLTSRDLFTQSQLAQERGRTDEAMATLKVVLDRDP